MLEIIADLGLRCPDWTEDYLLRYRRRETRLPGRPGAGML
jgi:hypothetical protein